MLTAIRPNKLEIDQESLPRKEKGERFRVRKDILTKGNDMELLAEAGPDISERGKQ